MPPASASRLPWNVLPGHGADFLQPFNLGAGAAGSALTAGRGFLDNAGRTLTRFGDDLLGFTRPASSAPAPRAPVGEVPPTFFGPERPPVVRGAEAPSVLGSRPVRAATTVGAAGVIVGGGAYVAGQGIGGGLKAVSDSIFGDEGGPGPDGVYGTADDERGEGGLLGGISRNAGTLLLLVAIVVVVIFWARGS